MQPGPRRALQAGWQVAGVPAGSIADPAHLPGLGELRWTDVTLPATAASALRAAGLWTWDDPRRFDAEDWWWRGPIERIAGDDHAVLVLDGIATLWDAWLDGVHVATGDNMFVAHEVPIGALLHEHSELVIRCRALDPELAKKRPRPRWRVPMLEQQQLRWIRTTLLGRTPGWSPRVPPVGPWRPIWIEQRGVAPSRIFAAGWLHDEAGVIETSLDGAFDAGRLVVERNGQRTTAELVKSGPTHAGDGFHWYARASIPDPARWWPHTHGEPALYAMSLVVTTGGRDTTIDLGSTGFRTIDVDQAGGDFAVRVNGVPVFARGACWTPLDAVSLGASPEALRAAVAQVRDAGMNMIRIGGTMVYETSALYAALDEAGVMLWQDLMFANMDYPEDPEFVASVVAEVVQQRLRLAPHPCLAVICGNSEGAQQAAMSSAGRERWSPPLFHEVIAKHVSGVSPHTAYVPSSTHGGAFPHQPNTGVASYYGVGAYLRPLDDARRSEVRFASECLAFANIPDARGLSSPGLRVHHPEWKARSPRDLGAGWDFDDVRDHYVQRLYGIDPVALRVADHERYLAIGRAATGEVMAQTFAEWRRARSTCRGALIWFLRDLWPGAGWGVIDATGAAKPAWYALRRALAPIAVAISDEGCNGLAVHVVNDRPEPLAARLELVLYRAGQIEVGRGASEVAVPGHGAIELAAAALFEGFLDLSFAYRFGPPLAHVVHATLTAGDRVLGETFAFPAGLPSTRELDVGLSAVLAGDVLTVATTRFAQSVSIDLPGFVIEDNGFHLAPGQRRGVRVTAAGTGRATPAPRGTVSALNADATARIEIAAS